MRKLMLVLTVLGSISVCLGILWPSFAGAVTSCATARPVLGQKLDWPIDGPVVRPWSLDCISGQGHRGIDIEAPQGSSIRTAGDGVVSFAGFTPAEGGGQTVTISHSTGLKSTYLHLSQLNVSKGESVSRGQVIGVSAGPTVHFGLKLGDGSGYLNPLELLKEKVTATQPKQGVPAPPAAPVTQPENPPAAPQPGPVSVGAPQPGSAAATAPRPVSEPSAAAAPNPVASLPGRPLRSVPLAGPPSDAAVTAQTSAPRGPPARQQGMRLELVAGLAGAANAFDIKHQGSSEVAGSGGSISNVRFTGAGHLRGWPGLLRTAAILAAVGVTIAAGAVSARASGRGFFPAPEIDHG